MDTSDSGITFDEAGVCDYCQNYSENIAPNWDTGEAGWREISSQANRIKAAGRGRRYDCLIGISGGVDSSYLTYVACEKLGLRPLILHVDGGWNSQAATNNIEKLVTALNLDLHTEVIDWEEMRDLQLAYFRANVPHLDTPQDHAFFASLYRFAAKNGIRNILTGANYSTECVREPLEWAYHASDLRQLLDIHARFGQAPLRSFPLCDISTYKIYYRFAKGVRVVKPLNYIPYKKEAAMNELVEKFGWQKYAHKHYESRFTRFFEGYWLPKKFGFDKRRAHFSSLILTSQMSRGEALAKLNTPPYDPEEMADDFVFVAKKLRISPEELKRLEGGPKCSYRDYKNNMWWISLGTRVLRATGVQRAVMR